MGLLRRIDEKTGLGVAGLTFDFLIAFIFDFHIDFTVINFDTDYFDITTTNLTPPLHIHNTT